MQKQNLQTLKGFRDFLPAEKRARDYVAAKIRETFERYGFEPLETPTLEYAELLLGKYGDEADKLVYSFEDRGGRKVALRYDQTVPTARVLAQYPDLGRGFRRYQIQNVFRADKPQKGRYREFTQCDADIFGSKSPIADAEIVAVYASIYRHLGFSKLTIKINDRETLMQTLSPFATDQVSVYSLIQSIDKLDKQTPKEVAQELVGKGITSEAASALLLAASSAQPSASLEQVMSAAEKLGVAPGTIVFTPTLARGLDYYTGMIFEGVIDGMTGSVGGGGRYDKLIESLGGPSIPAVGFGLGFDRTVEAAATLGLIPQAKNGTQVLVTMFSDERMPDSLTVAGKLRQAGINTEVYPAVDKMERQLKYADKKSIPYVVIVGEDEAKRNVVTLKNLSSREQQTLPIDEVISLLSNRA